MTTDNYKAYFLKDSDKKQKSSTMYNQYRKTTDPGTEGQQARNSVDKLIEIDAEHPEFDFAITEFTPANRTR